MAKTKVREKGYTSTKESRKSPKSNMVSIIAEILLQTKTLLHSEDSKKKKRKKKRRKS